MVRRPYARRRTENEPPTRLEVRATRRRRELDSNLRFLATRKLYCRALPQDRHRVGESGGEG
jgi:hypothetical protein